MFNLKDKVALVTGARRGMGRAHALALAKQGAHVVVTDVEKTTCESVAQEIRDNGGVTSCYKMDVSDTKEINQVFDDVIKEFGRLDILVNNAGIYEPKRALDISEADWDRMMDINLRGYFFCAQRAAKEMAKNKWGRIVNIASIASGGVGIGVAGGSHYTATKGGIIGMIEALAVEFAELGITVNCIGPGAIDTPMIGDAGIEGGAMKELLAGIPLKRVGKPEEVAAAVVFLSSEEASYITGSTFYIDGGWLAA